MSQTCILVYACQGFIIWLATRCLSLLFWFVLVSHGSQSCARLMPKAFQQCMSEPPGCSPPLCYYSDRSSWSWIKLQCSMHDLFVCFCCVSHFSHRQPTTHVPPHLCRHNMQLLILLSNGASSTLETAAPRARRAALNQARHTPPKYAGCWVKWGHMSSAGALFFSDPPLVQIIMSDSQTCPSLEMWLMSFSLKGFGNLNQRHRDFHREFGNSASAERNGCV